jgi:phosphoribosylaminoimidazole-succinocarboxamide synthase
MSEGLHTSNLSSLPLIGRGKVRDLYGIDDRRMLIVTTDRLSAFDVVMPQPIPDKGRILTEISNFWFHRLGHIVPHHLLPQSPREFLQADETRRLDGRAIVVKRVNPLPVEAVVRGYLIGSGWKDCCHPHAEVAGEPGGTGAHHEGHRDQRAVARLVTHVG